MQCGHWLLLDGLTRQTDPPVDTPLITALTCLTSHLKTFVSTLIGLQDSVTRRSCTTRSLVVMHQMQHEIRFQQNFCSKRSDTLSGPRRFVDCEHFWSFYIQLFGSRPLSPCCGNETGIELMHACYSCMLAFLHSA